MGREKVVLCERIILMYCKSFFLLSSLRPKFDGGAVGQLVTQVSRRSSPPVFSDMALMVNITSS